MLGYELGLEVKRAGGDALARIVAEPLTIRGESGPGVRQRVYEALRQVGLRPEHAARYPHEFSGGQQQRIGFARALIMNPALLVLDEPTSSLDVSIRAQIVNLLKEMQERLGLSYLFIAHDLSIVRQVSDRIAVMYLGRIVEIGPADLVAHEPIHPYAAMLIRSVPEPDPEDRDAPPPLGDPPDPIAPPPGCAFHPRCERARAVAAAGGVEMAGELPHLCVATSPTLLTQADGRAAACHFPITPTRG